MSAHESSSHTYIILRVLQATLRIRQSKDRETALASLLAALKYDRKQKLERDRVKDELALVREEIVTLEATRDSMLANIAK